MAEAETISASGISILYVDVLGAGCACGEASDGLAGAVAVVRQYLRAYANVHNHVRWTYFMSYTGIGPGLIQRLEQSERPCVR